MTVGIKTNPQNALVRSGNCRLWINGIFREDIYVTEFSDQHGMSPARLMLFAPGYKFKQLQLVRGDEIRCLMFRNGNLNSNMKFLGTITNIAEYYGTEPGVTIEALDYRIFLHRDTVIRDYNKFNLSAKAYEERASIATMLYDVIGRWKYNNAETHPNFAQLVLDIVSIPDTFPGEVLLEGNSVAQFLESIIREHVDGAFAWVMTYNADFIPILTIVNVELPTSERRYRYSTDPHRTILNQPSGSPNVSNITIADNSATKITRAIVVGDHYRIMAAIKLMPDWKIPDSTWYEISGIYPEDFEIVPPEDIAASKISSLDIIKLFLSKPEQFTEKNIHTPNGDAYRNECYMPELDSIGKQFKPTRHLMYNNSALKAVLQSDIDARTDLSEIYLVSEDEDIELPVDVYDYMSYQLPVLESSMLQVPIPRVVDESQDSPNILLMYRYQSDIRRVNTIFGNSDFVAAAKLPDVETLELFDSQFGWNLKWEGISVSDRTVKLDEPIYRKVDLMTLLFSIPTSTYLGNNEAGTIVPPKVPFVGTGTSLLDRKPITLEDYALWLDYISAELLTTKIFVPDGISRLDRDCLLDIAEAYVWHDQWGFSKAQVYKTPSEEMVGPTVDGKPIITGYGKESKDFGFLDITFEALNTFFNELYGYGETDGNYLEDFCLNGAYYSPAANPSNEPDATIPLVKTESYFTIFWNAFVLGEKTVLTPDLYAQLQSMVDDTTAFTQEIWDLISKNDVDAVDYQIWLGGLPAVFTNRSYNQMWSNPDEPYGLTFAREVGSAVFLPYQLLSLFFVFDVPSEIYVNTTVVDTRKAIFDTGIDDNNVDAKTIISNTQFKVQMLAPDCVYISDPTFDNTLHNIPNDILPGSKFANIMSLGSTLQNIKKHVLGKDKWPVGYFLQNDQVREMNAGYDVPDGVEHIDKIQTDLSAKAPMERLALNTILRDKLDNSLYVLTIPEMDFAVRIGQSISINGTTIEGGLRCVNVTHRFMQAENKNYQTEIALAVL